MSEVTTQTFNSPTDNILNDQPVYSLLQIKALQREVDSLRKQVLELTGKSLQYDQLLEYRNKKRKYQLDFTKEFLMKMIKVCPGSKIPVEDLHAALIFFAQDEGIMIGFHEVSGLIEECGLISDRSNGDATYNDIQLNEKDLTCMDF